MNWFRWYAGTLADPKWRVIARRSKTAVHQVLAVWVAVLENANESSTRGTLERFDVEDTAAALDMEADEVRAILKAMEGKVLDGDKLPGWGRRQPKREDRSTPRVRAFRERQEEMKRSETHGNARVEESREEEIREETATPPTPPAGRQEGSARDEFIRECFIAMNRGHLDNPAIGEGAMPLPSSHGSRETAGEWHDAGLPLELCKRVVYTAAKRYRPTESRRQVGTLKYFDSAVKEAHAKREADAAARSGPAPAELARDGDGRPAAPAIVRQTVDDLRARDAENERTAAEWREAVGFRWRALPDAEREQRIEAARSVVGPAAKMVPDPRRLLEMSALETYGAEIGMPHPTGQQRRAG